MHGAGKPHAELCRQRQVQVMCVAKRGLQLRFRTLSQCSQCRIAGRQFHRKKDSQRSGQQRDGKHQHPSYC
jgi:hypothetical protein